MSFKDALAADNHETDDEDCDCRKRRGDAAMADRTLVFTRSVIVVMHGKVQSEQPEHADQPEYEPAI